MYLLCSRFTRYYNFSKTNELKNNILETTASFLASGIDPEKSLIFNQSSVSAHSELAWIFNCIKNWMVKQNDSI